MPLHLLSCEKAYFAWAEEKFLWKPHDKSFIDLFSFAVTWSTLGKQDIQEGGH